jgi:hypothetical protein
VRPRTAAISDPQTHAKTEHHAPSSTRATSSPVGLCRCAAAAIRLLPILACCCLLLGHLGAGGCLEDRKGGGEVAPSWNGAAFQSASVHSFLQNSLGVCRCSHGSGAPLVCISKPYDERINSGSSVKWQSLYVGEQPLLYSAGMCRLQKPTIRRRFK